MLIAKSCYTLELFFSITFTVLEMPHIFVSNISLFLPKVIFCVIHSLFCLFSFHITAVLALS